MNEEHIKHLMKRYNEGDSSQKDEKYLIENRNKLNIKEKTIFDFIQQNKIVTPANFNETQWESFTTKQKQKKRNRYSYISIAASILIVVSVFLFKPFDQEMDIAEKQALLNEALLMLGPVEEETTQTILYEDELVIIYTSN